MHIIGCNPLNVLFRIMFLASICRRFLCYGPSYMQRCRSLSLALARLSCWIYGLILKSQALTHVSLHPVFCSRTDDSYPKLRLSTKHKQNDIILLNKFLLSTDFTKTFIKALYMRHNNYLTRKLCTYFYTNASITGM